MEKQSRLNFKHFKYLKRYISIVLLIAAAISGICGISGCKSKKVAASDYIFKYDLAVNPRTLDPQTAVDEYARLVISNIFEGLLNMDSDGNVVAGVAEDYSVSEDLTTYTFNLRKDVFWKDKNNFDAQCTAADFVFAFTRLFDPQVKSLNAADYFCILNSRQVNSGEMPLSALEESVRAEGDYKLVIRLEHPDSNFPVLLTAAPAFPCNEEFYIQASGRYGLINAKSPVPSNGGFYLTDWVYDPYWKDENRITLRRNEKTAEPSKASPAGVNFYMDRGEYLSNFTDGLSECVIINGRDVDSLVSSSKYRHDKAENSVWGITFNPSGAAADGNLRLALGYASDIESIDAQLTGYVKTSAVVPGGITMSGESFRETAGQPQGLSADPDKAREYYGETAALTERPVLIVPVVNPNADSSDAKKQEEPVLTFIKAITQQWQEKLSFFCNIETVSQTEYTERIAKGDYDMAATKIAAAYNSPSAILNSLTFTPADAESPSEAAECMEKARLAGTPEEAAKFFGEAENALLKTAEFIPFCFTTEYFFFNKNIEGLTYNPFTRVIGFHKATTNN